jgi:hypothetical protein
MYIRWFKRGGSIHSFGQQLLEIEILNWSLFKKLLQSKKEKQEFDKVFDSVRLYTPYLGNASNPIVIESVMMGAICHHYKQLLQITKEVISINKDSLTDELVSILETKPEGKVLFYRFSKIWYNFIYSLHKEDRLILLNMILEICCYSESVSSALSI